MAPTLLELQSMVSSFMRSSADRRALDYLQPGGITADKRLQIYRHNFQHTLVQVLGLTYPCVLRLVGSDFFNAAAFHFVELHPAANAWLDSYGGDFPRFLAQYQPAAVLPYLADVAQLEWLLNQALHAVDVAACDPDLLAGLDDEDAAGLRFELHPALGLMRSAWPVDRIWSAVMDADDERLAAIQLDAGTSWLLVSSGPQGLDIRPVAEGDWRFADALRAGMRLDEAAQMASSDVSALLADHLARHDFVSFQLDAASLP